MSVDLKEALKTAISLLESATANGMEAETNKEVLAGMYCESLAGSYNDSVARRQALLAAVIAVEQQVLDAKKDVARYRASVQYWRGQIAAQAAA